METSSLKALALRALAGNHAGNHKEIKSFPVELPRVGNQETTGKKVRAKGYGCAGCGNKIYRAVQAWEMTNLPGTLNYQNEHTSIIHWKCEGCGALFGIIGGMKGPQPIN